MAKLSGSKATKGIKAEEACKAREELGERRSGGERDGPWGENAHTLCIHAWNCQIVEVKRQEKWFVAVYCVLSKKTAYMKPEGKVLFLWVDESSLPFGVMILGVQEGMPVVGHMPEGGKGKESCVSGPCPGVELLSGSFGCRGMMLLTHV